MKNTLLCSFVFASLCLGCSQSELDPKSGEASTKSIKVIDPELQKWVGQYKGILSCAACTSFCEGCEGMTVDLDVKEKIQLTFRAEYKVTIHLSIRLISLYLFDFLQLTKLTRIADKKLT